MTRLLVPLVFLLSLTPSLFAQTQILAGAGIGQQAYQANEENPRVLAGADILVLRHEFGAHLASEYADLFYVGGLVATHMDAIWRHPLGSFFFTAGAGPTLLIIEQGTAKLTWNAEVELGRAWRKAEVYARVRQYDFTVGGFREESSPKGPALSVGIRLRIK